MVKDYGYVIIFIPYSLGIGIGRFRRRCVVILLYSKRIVYVLHAV